MINAAILGATGVIGQELIIALQNHPWYEITKIAASKRSAGKEYKNAITDEEGSLSWYCDEYPSDEILNMKVEEVSEFDAKSVDVIFTALESDVSKSVEPKLAKIRPVISTASAFRHEKDVPILIPGINSEHSKILNDQKKRRGWEGFIAPIPNCTTTGLVITLKPMLDRFGLNIVLMTSLQALSGSGRNPGVRGLDIIDNVIPFIPEEEYKVQKETLKILGKYENGKILPADVKVSCTCTRINVKDGHTESVFTSTKKESNIDTVKEAMSEYDGGLKTMRLPSSPNNLIVVNSDNYRPQPRFDRQIDDGMATIVGRIRSDSALSNGIKYVLFSHNTKMGGAKGAVLVAEMLTKQEFIKE